MNTECTEEMYQAFKECLRNTLDSETVEDSYKNAIEAALEANNPQPPALAYQEFSVPDCPDCACVQDGECLCIPSKPELGGEMETLAWLVDDSKDGHSSVFRNDPTGWAHGYQVRELIDRAHVARLEAELSLFKDADLKVEALREQEAEIAKLQAEVERLRNDLNLVADVFHIGSAARDGKTILANVRGVIDQREQLKARNAALEGLLSDALEADPSRNVMGWDWHNKANAALAEVEKS